MLVLKNQNMLRRSVSTIAVVVAALFTVYLFIMDRQMRSFSTGPFPMDWTVDLPNDDTAFGGIFYEPDINDSLPYYQYRQIADSVKRIKDFIAYNNKSMGNGRAVGAIGVLQITKDEPFRWQNYIEKDPIMKGLQDSLTLLHRRMTGLKESDSIISINKLLDEVMRRINVRTNELLRQKHQQAEKQYYLGLNGYSTSDYNTRFFVDKNGYNLAYVVWDGVRKRTFDSTMYGHYESKSIPVRYAADEKKVLIPITQQQHRYFSLALEWGSYLVFFLSFYLFVGLLLQILWSISKGKAFTPKNTQRFRLMSIALFVYALACATTPYILRIIFRDLIPQEFVLESFGRALLGQLSTFVGALGLYMISKAFERGYKLQQENALTI
jgi:hypothetical protein